MLSTIETEQFWENFGTIAEYHHHPPFVVPDSLQP